MEGTGGKQDKVVSTVVFSSTLTSFVSTLAFLILNPPFRLSKASWWTCQPRSASHPQNKTRDSRRSSESPTAPYLFLRRDEHARCTKHEPYLTVPCPAATMTSREQPLLLLLGLGQRWLGCRRAAFLCRSASLPIQTVPVICSLSKYHNDLVFAGTHPLAIKQMTLLSYLHAATYKTEISIWMWKTSIQSSARS